MLRFKRYPNEKEIFHAASLAALTSLPVELLGTISNETLYLKTDVLKRTSGFIRERALLYAFYTEEQLRSDFSENYFIADDEDLAGLEFHAIERPHVSNAIHGMALSYYANRILNNLPGGWRYFRICLSTTHSREAILDTIRRSLYGERQGLEAMYAFKDHHLIVEFSLMATSDETKRTYRLRWLRSILLYLAHHYGLEPLSCIVDGSSEHFQTPFFASLELTEVAMETVLNRLTRKSYEFACFHPQETPSHPIFNLPLEFVRLTPPNDALLCVDTIRTIRLEALEEYADELVN